LFACAFPFGVPPRWLSSSRGAERRGDPALCPSSRVGSPRFAQGRDDGLRLQRRKIATKPLRRSSTRTMVRPLSAGPSGLWRIGASPSGKAADFDSAIRRFESSRPSQCLQRLRLSALELCSHMSAPCRHGNHSAIHHRRRRIVRRRYRRFSPEHSRGQQ
jgi:hypothetical protein